MEQEEARGSPEQKAFLDGSAVERGGKLNRRRVGEEENSGSRGQAVLITSVTSLNVALRKQNHPENH